MSGRSVPPLLCSSDNGPSSPSILNTCLNDSLPLAVPGNASNNNVSQLADLSGCRLGGNDEPSSHSPRLTSPGAKHAPFYNTGDETIPTYLHHNVVQPSAKPSSATSISSANSVDAYPLVEDQEPTTTSEVPPEVKMPHTKRLTPTSIMVVDTISTVRSRVLLKVLFDPGSTATLISRKCLPRHCKTCPIAQGRKINTLAGSCATKEMVVMRSLRLPELDKNRVVDQQKALVFDGTCKYDVILGADFLLKSGIDIKYSSRIIEWFDSELPM